MLKKQMYELLKRIEKLEKIKGDAMKRTLSVIIFVIAIVAVLSAQSNYEILLSRPDIDGLTGGGATKLDGIATTGLATGTMVAVYDGSETRIYRLTAGTDAESVPTIIRPDDYAAGNQKVWIARLSSDPSETGFAGGGGGNWADSTTFIMVDGQKGIFGYGNVGYGIHDSTHVDLGVACTTGTSGQNYKYAAVGGGINNRAKGDKSKVGGGEANNASGSYSAIGGGYHNTTNGLGATVAGGYSNSVSTNYTTIAGGYDNNVDAIAATIAGGYSNDATASYATVGGGTVNGATGNYSVVGGGYNNIVNGWSAVIGGGYHNTASDTASTVICGRDNDVSGKYSYAFGRNADVATDYTARFFSAANPGSLLVGGDIRSEGALRIGNIPDDAVADSVLTVDGGQVKKVAASALGGGGGSWTPGITIGNGTNDTTLVTNGKWGLFRDGNTGYGNECSTHVNLGVACTTGNASNSQYCTVGGGFWNTASGMIATVSGGSGNTATQNYSTIGGGLQNTASGQQSTVSGGVSNTASGNVATVGGGFQNTASGAASAIPGGYADTVSGNYSFVFGRHAIVNTDYTARFFSAANPGSLLVGGNARFEGDAKVEGDVEVGLADAFYFGDPNTDDTWRIIRDGDDLVIQRRESGGYVDKLQIED